MTTILELPPGAPGIRMAYGSDPNQFGELHLPGQPGPHPVVIFVHGGFWRAKYDLTHARYFCNAIAEAGCAVWSVEYRRVGQTGGGYPGTFDDVLAGAKHLAQIPGFDRSRVIVAGHSAGGQLALWLAAQEIMEVREVITLAAVSDLGRARELNLGDGAVAAFLGGAGHDSFASPIERLPLRVPQRLLHGTADDVVPIELSQRFASASTNAQLIPLPGAGHLELIDPRSNEWPTVLRHICEPVTRR
jgi:Dipeptidyl aminopeptidases/acylaminoacyl-peptidases